MIIGGWVLAAVALILVLAALFHSAVGFGSNLIAIPLVAQFEPELVPGSLVLAALVLNAMIMVRERAAITLRPLAAACVGAVAGSAIGVTVVARISAEALQVLVASCVLAMVALLVQGRRAPLRSRRNLLMAGVAAGFGSTAAGIGGPPIALLYSDAEGREIRSALASFFMLTGSLTLSGLRLAGHLDRGQALTGLGLVPAIVAGFLLGRRLIPIVDRGFTRPAILAVSGGSAAVLLLRVVLG